ncbi:MAG: hypothetical protein QXE10_04795 [Desulfurococcaceae archaeon]
MHISKKRKQSLKDTSPRTEQLEDKLKNKSSKKQRGSLKLETTKTGESLEEKTTHRSVKKRATSINIDKLLDEVFEQVDSMFALTSDLQLPLERAREIVKELVENIAAGYSSKPSGEAIVKKIKKNQNIISEYIASKILSESDKLTPSQLEFAIMRGGRAVLSEVDRLYKLATHQGREDLVSLLRHAWNTYGPKGMIECPMCGFNAVSPDRNCLTCGATVSEEYVRKTLGFDEKFELYLKTASVAELNELLQLGQVLVGEKGVYSPRSRKARLENPVVYVVYLKNSEISRIIEEINSRDLPI